MGKVKGESLGNRGNKEVGKGREKRRRGRGQERGEKEERT